MTIDDMMTSHACERLVKQFAVFNDMDQPEDLAALFVKDGSFARPLDPDSPIIGRDAILEMFKSRPPRLSRHFMTNCVINPLSSDEAEGITYVMFLSTTDVDADWPIACEPSIYMGEYRDSFKKTDGEWRFRSRRGAMTLVFKA